MKNNHINYVEFEARDLEAVKTFYSEVFNWEFTDYGPNYTSFSNSGIQGGFEQSDEPIANGVLIVLFHDNLESIIVEVVKAGGILTKEIFSFPGGRRFQFKDPAGNELAVWTEDSTPLVEERVY
jgi:predicted enzyme related to lactoylglutathione lyase